LNLPYENQNYQVFTVSELTKEIQRLLDDRFDFLWLEGEISNFSSPVSGHYYMVIKDEKSRIKAVMFRFQTRYLRFLPENGMKVLARGRIGVYTPRGEYQLILDYLEPVGVGALALAFEQLKTKLAARGIFDNEIKKPIPFLPQRVAVITSPTGAAILDFLKIIYRRFANIDITIIPVRVQGKESQEDIVKAIELVNMKLKADVIVLTRGGGSLEDLCGFNQENVAMAIRASHIPVVSAVGHEIDLTISDLAADFRAPTPSAAAELLVAEKESLLNRLGEIKKRLITGIMHKIKEQNRELLRLTATIRDPRKRLADTWIRLDEIHARILRLTGLVILDSRRRLETEKRNLIIQSPTNIINSLKERLDIRKMLLVRSMNKLIVEKQKAVSHQRKRISDLSPMAILKRGYSITLKLPEKSLLKDTSGVKKGNQVRVLLAEGELECRVDRVNIKDFRSSAKIIT